MLSCLTVLWVRNLDSWTGHRGNGSSLLQGVFGCSSGDSNGWELEPMEVAWHVSLSLLSLSTWHLGLPHCMAASGKLVLHRGLRLQVPRGSDRSCKILGILVRNPERRFCHILQVKQITKESSDSRGADGRMAYIHRKGGCRRQPPRGQATHYPAHPPWQGSCVFYQLTHIHQPNSLLLLSLPSARRPQPR